MRYDFVELRGFDRDAVHDLIAAARSWAEKQIE